MAQFVARRRVPAAHQLVALAVATAFISVGVTGWSDSPLRAGVQIGLGAVGLCAWLSRTRAGSWFLGSGLLYLVAVAYGAAANWASRGDVFAASRTDLTIGVALVVVGIALTRDA